MTYIQWVTVITRPKYRIGKAQSYTIHPFPIPKSRNLSKYPGVTSDCLAVKLQNVNMHVIQLQSLANTWIVFYTCVISTVTAAYVSKSWNLKSSLLLKVKSFKAKLARFLWSQIHMLWATLNNHFIQYLQPKMKMYLLLKLTLVAACVTTVQNEQVSWKDMKVCLY